MSLLPTPGNTITLSMVRNLFGLSNPISLGHMYGRASGIPSSGSISLSATLGGKGPVIVNSGRYIRLRLTNPGFMNAAELRAYNTAGTNVALNKSVVMSSAFEWAGWEGSKLTDGSTTTYAHTSQQVREYAWMRVDLGSQQTITRIVVVNRTEDSTGSRLNGAVVDIMDTTSSIKWTSNLFTDPYGSTTWQELGAGYNTFTIYPPNTAVNGA